MRTAKKVAMEIAPQIPPALTPEGRRAQMTAYAMALSEKRLREGTASSQEIVFWLKQGDPKEELELKKLEKENELLSAKTESIRSMKEVGELAANAIEAMRRYSARGLDDE